RSRVNAEKPQRPFFRGKVVNRNSRVVLEYRGAVLQEKISHRFEPSFMEEVGSSFQQAVCRSECLAKTEEAGISLQCFIRKIGSKVIERFCGTGRGVCESDFRAPRCSLEPLDH